MTPVRNPVVELATVKAMNTLVQQAKTGVLDPDAVVAPLRELEEPEDAVNLGDYLRTLKEIPVEPVGWKLRNCDQITEATGGLFGLWVIGGEPGVGKSTFALQVLLGIAETGITVILVDAENGKDATVRRAYLALRKDRDRLARVLRHVIYVPSARGLDTILAKHPAPALLVVDSLQKLPTKLDQRRTGLDAWLRRFEIYKKDMGYTVLLLSEMPRSTYKKPDEDPNPWVGAFAETREIEYTADLAAQMIENSMGHVNFYIVKNRNRPRKGFITTLKRLNTGWAYTEGSGL
jgi:KaiC/GvpD/RAD55 family RecA-like ATPase